MSRRTGTWGGTLILHISQSHLLLKGVSPYFWGKCTWSFWSHRHLYKTGWFHMKGLVRCLLSRPFTFYVFISSWNSSRITPWGLFSSHCSGHSWSTCEDWPLEQVLSCLCVKRKWRLPLPQKWSSCIFSSSSCWVQLKALYVIYKTSITKLWKVERKRKASRDLRTQGRTEWGVLGFLCPLTCSRLGAENASNLAIQPDQAKTRTKPPALSSQSSRKRHTSKTESF